MASRQIGIDLGTANILFYLRDHGIILSSPSVIAIDKDKDDVVAIGSAAKRMLGKTPKNIRVSRPIKDGVVADLEETTVLLHELFMKAELVSFFNRPDAVVSIPYGVTEVEKRAVETAVYEAGTRSVVLMEEPLAAAVGAGLKVLSAKGSMIVDIGGGTTETAVISLGDIAIARSEKIAGDDIDRAIVNYFYNEKRMLIGEGTAELLKIHIGTAHGMIDRGEKTVYGRSLENGLAMSISVGSREILYAIRPALASIVRQIQQTLEVTPPELTSDVCDSGIVLTGGGSLLPGLAEYATKELGIKVKLAQKPLESVCVGIGRMIDSEGELGKILRRRI